MKNVAPATYPNL